jgi:hypothetical protein
MAAQNIEFHFKGPPESLHSPTETLPVPFPASSPALQIGARRHELRFHTTEKSGMMLRLELPRNTAPGTIGATVRIGDQSYPATIEVEESVRIITDPEDLRLTGSPNSEVATVVRATNAGNVDREIEPSQRVMMRDAEALPRGLRKAFQDTKGDIVSRLVRLGEHLSSEPEKYVTFKLKPESNALRAGEEQKVRVSAVIPVDFKNGSRWSGSVSIFGKDVRVLLEIIEQEGRK